MTSDSRCLSERVYRCADDLEGTRTRLEIVATDFCRALHGSWKWDDSRMHLTVSNHNGDPVATFHVELQQ